MFMNNAKSTRPPEAAFFLQPSSPPQRMYEALRAYFVDQHPAHAAARQFGYSPGSFYVLCTHFRTHQLPPFFRESKRGPKRQPKKDPVRDLVVALRKRNRSIYDIRDALREQGRPLSLRSIWEILREAGFARLPRRLDEERPERARPEAAPRANRRAFALEAGAGFPTEVGGVFLFVPLLVELGFDRLVEQAGYPGTRAIPALQSLLALLALKLLGRKRVSHVMDLAHDRGLGLFAGLNAVPKTTALIDYSYRTQRGHNLALLRGMVQALRRQGMLPGESFNLDFHAIPHFGEQSILERHYVPRRSHAEKSVLTFLAQDNDSRVICYANARLLKRDKAEEVLRFVDFWKRTTGELPKELVFDARLTTPRTLYALDERGIRFLTLRPRSAALVRALLALPAAAWTRCHLDVPHRKYRTPRIHESRVRLKDYPADLRQIAAIDLGRDQPTLLITNDFRPRPETLLTRYAQRMIVENAIADGVHFFHLDALSSDIQIEADLSVTLTAVGNALYHTFARQIRGFEEAQAGSLARRFINTMATVRIGSGTIELTYPKRAGNPLLVEAGYAAKRVQVPWLHEHTLSFAFS